MSNSSISIYDVVSVTYHQQKLLVEPDKEVMNLSIIIMTSDGSQVTVDTFSDKRQTINQEER